VGARQGDCEAVRGLRPSELAACVLWAGVKVGDFEPEKYRREIVENADFRGYDDGLRMTIDCTVERAVRPRQALLQQARTAGIIRYGLHREDTALPTCIAPLPTQSDRVHFIDGASRGYALAAMRLKAGG